MRFLTFIVGIASVTAGFFDDFQQGINDLFNGGGATGGGGSDLGDMFDALTNFTNSFADIWMGKHRKFNHTEAHRYIDDISEHLSQLQNFTDSMMEIQDSLRLIGTMSLDDVTTQIERVGKNFTYRAKKLNNDAETTYESDKLKVKLPKLPYKNQTLSTIEWTSNPYKSKEKPNGKKIVSNVVSIMLADALSGNETHIKGLAEKINITLPLKNLDLSKYVPECVYWDVPLAEWRTDGCWLGEITNGVVTCGCNHLTDFSVASATIPPTQPSSSASGSSNGSNSSVGAIVGGILGAGCVILVIGAATVYVQRRKAKRRVVQQNPVAHRGSGSMV